MHYYFPGMVVGFILLQTAIIAPTIFKNLDKDSSKVVIRAMWPKFFIGLAVIGLCSSITMYFHSGIELVQYSIGGLTFIFAIACYAMIPATNRAKDEGNEKRFNLLHKSSVYLTIAVLIMNVGFLFV